MKSKTILFVITVLLFSCKKAESPPPEINTFYKEVITTDDRKIITPEEAKTYHVDKHRKYEYRTGDPRHYEYNYDVKGINSKGDSVFGNINVHGKNGAGLLFFDTIEDAEIKTEWIGYGKLKAKDKQGNEYDLVVE